MNAALCEWQAENERLYGKWAAKASPELQAKFKTALGWKSAGKSVKRGARAMVAKVKVSIAAYNPITGETETDYRLRECKVFSSDQVQ